MVVPVRMYLIFNTPRRKLTVVFDLNRIIVLSALNLILMRFMSFVIVEKQKFSENVSL